MHQKFVVNGGRRLTGKITLSGAKNVALKALAAALLTDEQILLENIPLITDLKLMVKIISSLGVEVSFYKKNQLKVHAQDLKKAKVDLDMGAHLRTSSMLLVPILRRLQQAIVPNPGGCRIGARPIDRHIEGLRLMGIDVSYNSADGYFYAQNKKLVGCRYRFSKNTHTGTETMILAAVLANGQTILENAAYEPEVDDLIRLLNTMGANIHRVEPRTIVINGVKKLHGTSYRIMPDRNEAVTFAIAAYVTGGDLIISGTQRFLLKSFLEELDGANACWEPVDEYTTRFYHQGKLKATYVKTGPHPGFMTDWQAPWCLLMTQAEGESIIHETVFEDRFGYVSELCKTGANISLFNPKVKNPEKLYNFNWSDNKKGLFHALKIKGSTPLHNAVMNITDLRAGATLVIASLGVKGESILHGIEHIDRGYESLDTRLNALGADIKRMTEKSS